MLEQRSLHHRLGRAMCILSSFMTVKHSNRTLCDADELEYTLTSVPESPINMIGRTTTLPTLPVLLKNASS